jgi:hypothetical protein
MVMMMSTDSRVVSFLKICCLSVASGLAEAVNVTVVVGLKGENNTKNTFIKISIFQNRDRVILNE